MSEILGLKKVKLKLGPHPEFSQFDTIDATLEDASIMDWVTKGLHLRSNTCQIDDQEVCRRVEDCFSSGTTIPSQLGKSGLGGDSRGIRFKTGIKDFPKSTFHEVFIVPDDYEYKQFMKFVKDEARKKWTDRFVEQLLRAKYFGKMPKLREKLRSKDPELKISSYEDLGTLSLGEIFAPDDFEYMDILLIDHTLPYRPLIRNKVLFNELVSHPSKEPYLKSAFVGDDFRDNPSKLLTFMLNFPHYSTAGSSVGLVVLPQMGAEKTGDSIIFKIGAIFTNTPTVECRNYVKNISKEFKDSGGNYVFYIHHVKKLEEMIFSKKLRLGLNTKDSKKTFKKGSPVPTNSVPRFQIKMFCSRENLFEGNVVRHDWTKKELQEILRYYGEKVGGRKPQIKRRVKALLSKLFHKFEPALNEYFSKCKFIRTPNPSRRTSLHHINKNKRIWGSSRVGKYLSLWDKLGDSIFIGNFEDTNKEAISDEQISKSDIEKAVGKTILAVYVLKHLRGDAILDGDYCNDAYEVKSLFDGIIEQGKKIPGVFVGLEKEEL